VAGSGNAGSPGWFDPTTTVPPVLDSTWQLLSAWGVVGGGVGVELSSLPPQETTSSVPATAAARVRGTFRFGNTIFPPNYKEAPGVARFVDVGLAGGESLSSASAVALFGNQGRTRPAGLDGSENAGDGLGKWACPGAAARGRPYDELVRARQGFMTVLTVGLSSNAMCQH